MNAWYQEPNMGYWNCNSRQILIVDGYVKVRNFLYIQVNIHGDTQMHLARVDGFAWYL